MPVHRLASFVLLVVLVLASGAAAQSVFFTGPNNQISAADFGAGTATAVVTSVGSNFQGLAVREDGLLLVADSAQGGSLVACDAASGACAEIAPFDQAEGLDLAAEGTLFAVNASEGGPDTVVAVLKRGGCPDGVAENADCLPGGYDRTNGAVTIDADIEQVDLLADVKFVAFDEGQFSLNGLAVLAEVPPALLVYDEPLDDHGHGAAGVHSPWQECQGLCQPRLVLSSEDFAGEQPRGFDFAPDNTLLISTKSGRVLRFTPDGTRLPDFALLPGSGEKLAVGVDSVAGSPTIRAFVAVHNGGILQRYDFAPGSQPDEIVEGVNSPKGVAISTSTSFAATPAGQDVTVSTGGLITTWEQVSAPGTALVLCTNIVDPRPDGVMEPLYLCEEAGNPSCKQPGDATQYGVDLGLEAIIPSYARAYRKLVPGDDPTDPAFPGDPVTQGGPGPSGPLTFRICRASTTAQFTGLVFDVAQEETYLGYDPAHPGGDPDLFDCDEGPRFYYGTLPGENPIPETPMTIDTSLTCGLNLQGFFQRSILIPNAIDLRDLDGPGSVATAAGCTAGDGVLDCKLAILEQVYEDGGRCVGNPVRQRASNALNKAIRAFDMGSYADAQVQLCSFEGLVEGNPGQFGQCEPTLRDHLRARTKSASYILGLLNGQVNFSCFGP